MRWKYLFKWVFSYWLICLWVVLSPATLHIYIYILLRLAGTTLGSCFACRPLFWRDFDWISTFVDLGMSKKSWPVPPRPKTAAFLGVLGRRPTQRRIGEWCQLATWLCRRRIKSTGCLLTKHVASEKQDLQKKMSRSMEKFQTCRNLACKYKCCIKTCITTYS